MKRIGAAKTRIKTAINLLFDASHEVGDHMGGIESFIRNAKLVEIDNVWVLLYKDREYIRLLDAKSRDDAEQQIAEMLLLRDTDQQSSSKSPTRPDQGGVAMPPHQPKH